MAKLKLYGILAHAAGSRELEINASGCESVKCVIERLTEKVPGLKRALDILDWDLVILIDGKPGSLDSPPGDVIALFPPASGGLAGYAVKALVLSSGEDLDFNSIIRWLANQGEDLGAIALFIGVVRGLNRGEKVEYLEYDYDPERLQRELERLAKEVVEKHGLRGAFVAHYVGRRLPGELTLIVAVAGDHRKRVYPALEELVDRVKHEAPIWKTELRGGSLVFMVGDREVRADEIRG